MQIPPTPTPFPTVAPGENVMPSLDFSLWDFAPDAVQAWNLIPSEITQLIIGFLLALLIIFGLSMVIGFGRWLISGGESSSGGSEEADIETAGEEE